MPESLDSDCACSMKLLTKKRLGFEARQLADRRMSDAEGFEQFAHLGAAVAEQALDRTVDLRAPVGQRQRSERGGAFLDAEIAEKAALLDRARDARAHA